MSSTNSANSLQLPQRSLALAAMVTLIVVIVVATMLLWKTSLRTTLEARWLSIAISATHSGAPVSAPVMIIAIDDTTYANTKASPRWPFPLKHLRVALERLLTANPARVIVAAEALKLSTEADAATERANILSLLKQHNGAIWINGSSDDTFADVAMINAPALPRGELIWRMQQVSTEAPDQLLRFYGPKGTISRISLSDLLDESMVGAQDTFNNKTVLIGFQGTVRARGQLPQDEYAVAYGKGTTLFGVEVFATALANTVATNPDERALATLPVRTEFLLVLAAVTLTTVIGLILSPLMALPLLAVLLAAIVAVQHYCSTHIISAHMDSPLWIMGVPFIAIAALSAVCVRAFYHTATIHKIIRRLSTIYRVGSAR